MVWQTCLLTLIQCNNLQTAAYTIPSTERRVLIKTQNFSLEDPKDNNKTKQNTRELPDKTQLLGS